MSLGDHLKQGLLDFNLKDSVHGTMRFLKVAELLLNVWWMHNMYYQKKSSFNPFCSNLDDDVCSIFITTNTTNTSHGWLFVWFIFLISCILHVCRIPRDTSRTLVVLEDTMEHALSSLHNIRKSLLFWQSLAEVIVT